MKKFLLVVMCGLALAGMVWARGAQSSGGGGTRISIITMDNVDEHWLKLRSGAEDKARELGVTVTFDAGNKWDPALQLSILEDTVTKKVDAILLAPSDATALLPGINRAIAAGIPVVLVDSGANYNYDILIGTDNGAAARLAADEMAKLINQQGKVAIINAQAGAGTTMTRENEFKAQIASKYPNITIVGTQYSDGDPTRALNIATDYMTANPDLAGIYACNEGATVGSGMAIEQAGKGGSVKLIGWDWTANTLGLVQRGVLSASMVQDPYQMGYLGVQAAVDLINKKPVQKDVDSGVIVATRDNYTTIK
jgi:ribose transport system substrate-binding protein